jgi:hypothetical protein
MRQREKEVPVPAAGGGASSKSSLDPEISIIILGSPRFSLYSFYAAHILDLIDRSLLACTGRMA